MSDWKNVQYKDGKFKTGEGGGGGGSSTFAGLDDVSFSNIQNGQVPKYNSTTQKWENANESSGGGTVTDVQVDGVSVVNQQGVAEIEMPTPPSVPDKLSDLSDVQFSNLTDHQPLRYNATSQKWENGADNYPPLIYSDEEREIGVWRDGKPLYQKTFIKQLSGTATQIDISSINAETIFIYTGYYDMGVTKLSLNEWMGSSVYTYTHINPTSQHYNIDCHCSIAQNTTIHITVQYTKTTDTAGSGTWTTQGGYAHHYSTSEKVVGTWVDGKPLYEKTITFTPNSSHYTVDVSSLNIDDCVYLNGWFINIGGNYIFLNHYAGNSDWHGLIYSPSNGGCLIADQDNSSRFGLNCPWTATIRYTKTTD